MSAEVVFALAYAALLLAVALALEWLAAHTHRRAQRFRTAGFTYDSTRDFWVCPEGEHLWPHRIDHQHRLMRYRARAHVCNACVVKGKCTDSDRGREVVRPLDPWPHSEAGRFHRIIALLLVALALLVVVVAAARHHRLVDVAALGTVFVAALVAGRWLLRDLHAHPANFPEPNVR